VQVRGKETYCIHSVENALALLEALCEEGEEVSLSGLSSRLGMTKASLFRLLATFENHGYVEREPGSRKYRLGMAAYEIGQKFLSRMGLLQKAHPVMEHLAREFNEAVYLTVRRGDEALFLDMVDSTQQVKIVPLVGRRFSLTRCAPGKVILSHESSPREGRREPKSVAGLDAKEKEGIREAGVCLDNDGVGDGSTCIAVPLFEGGGKIVGALALLGPEFRLPKGLIEDQLIPALKIAGEIISSRLGFVGHHFTSRSLPEVS